MDPPSAQIPTAQNRRKEPQPPDWPSPSLTPFHSHKKANQVTCNPQNKRAFMTRRNVLVPREEISHDTIARLLFMTGLEKVLERRDRCYAYWSGVGVWVIKWTGITQAKGLPLWWREIDFRPTLRRRSLVVISERNRRHNRISSGPYNKRGGYSTHTYVYADHHRLSRGRNERLNGAKGVLIMVHFYISPPSVTGP